MPLRTKTIHWEIHYATSSCESNISGVFLAHTDYRHSPDVDFCGYSIPHPSEAKRHLRIQSRGSKAHLSNTNILVGPAAVEILRKGLDDLHVIMETLVKKFDVAMEAGEFEHHPEVEL